MVEPRGDTLKHMRFRVDPMEPVCEQIGHSKEFPISYCSRAIVEERERAENDLLGLGTPTKIALLALVQDTKKHINLKKREKNKDVVRSSWIAYRTLSGL